MVTKHDLSWGELDGRSRVLRRSIDRGEVCAESTEG